MNTITNPACDRLRRDELAIGVGVRAVRGVEIAPIMKTAGFDWLFIDLEHGATSIETAASICIAALAVDIAPLVRVPQGDGQSSRACGRRHPHSFAFFRLQIPPPECVVAARRPCPRVC